jgi:hypothetical protein
MKTTLLIFAFLLGVSCGASACTRQDSRSQPPTTQEVSEVYICPMHPEAGEFPHPGTCPICGMKLVLKGK